jgi:probable phosphoglycerate mutase
MTTLLLIRHGETGAVGNLLAGSMPGWHLNPRGRQQVERLAGSLASRALKAVYTSPLERAVETARAIARCHGVEPKAVKEIGELDVGEWQGKTFEELAARPDWKAYNALRSAVRPPGGEWMIDCQARMVKEAERLVRRHPEGTVAVVSHADPIRGLLAYYLGIPMDLMLRFELGTASVSAVQMSDGVPRVLCLNRTEEVPE